MNNTGKVLLTIGSCVGVAGTIVLTHFNTIKAQKLLAERHLDDWPKKLDEMKETWTCYIPTMIAGTLTIASIIVNHKITSKQIAALLATGATSFATLNKYKAKVKEIAGHDTFIEIEKAIARDEEMGILRVSPAIYKENLLTGGNDPIAGGDTLFFESATGTWFRSSMAAVMDAQYHINRNFALRGEASLSEYLSFLGINDNWCHSDIGWGFPFIEGGCYWIDFDIVPSKAGEEYSGEEYYIVSPTFAAEPLEEEEDE